jgi:glycosyltransferase involved in cell wall biosynthesis
VRTIQLILGLRALVLLRYPGQRVNIAINNLLRVEQRTAVSSYQLLFIQPVGEKGGMEVNLLKEVRYLDRTKFSPIVACLQDGPIVDDLRALGAEVHLILRGRLRNLPRTLLTVLRLVGLMKRRGVSLVISQNSYSHIYGRPAAMIGRVPAILRTGGVANPVDRTDRTAFALGASLFIANSQFTKRALVAAGVSEHKVRIVNHGVVPSDFDTVDDSRARVRTDLGLSQEALVVTTVGRLQEWKGQHVAIAAAAMVVRQFPKARFLIVGDALFGIEREYPQRLQSLVRDLDLSEHVLMLGHRNDIPAIMAASDLVLNPSVRPEPFGIVTIEAMAAGKPVVASDAGGSPEILTHGETGMLVTPNDPQALAGAITQLLASNDLRDAMGMRGRQVIRDRFTVERAVLGWQEAYLECLQPLLYR